MSAPSFLTRLTSLRILLVPAVMGLVLGGARFRVAGAALFAIAAVTDLLDGYLARRWKATTTLGSFLDTTADKLLISGVLIALVGRGRASPWIAAVIVAREFAILGLRGVVAVDGEVMRPSMWGKLKFGGQVVAILLAILRFRVSVGPLLLDEWAMIAAAAITVASAVQYLRRFSSVFSKSPP